MDGPLEYYPCLSILANSITNLTSQQEQKEDWGHIIKSLALKKWIFTHKKYFPIFFFTFLYLLFYATLQCGPYNIFINISNSFFCPQKQKKQASKVTHNRPKPFFLLSSPEFIFHIMNMSKDSSVSLSVPYFTQQQQQQEVAITDFALHNLTLQS